MARKEKVKTSSYFGLIQKFKEENPDSFYVGKAAEEMQAVVALVEKSIAEIRALGEKGDVHAKFTLIEEAKARFARIPAFDEANAGWRREFKQPETKQEYSVGKAYAKIFADLDILKSRFRKLDAKNSEIRSARSRAKAVEKSKQYYMSKLKPIAGKLEKLADSHADSYYGKGAKAALDGYVKSGRQTLENPLTGKGK